jgi:hypothetical protein
MSWTKDKNGQWVWTPDGKGNPQKAGDNVTPPPSFGMGSNTPGSGINDSVYKVDIGFGLVDANGNPLALPPIQIGSYITTLAGTDPKAYARVKSAVTKLTGRTKVDPNYVGGYVSKLATNIMGSSDIIARTGTLEDYFSNAAKNAAAGGVGSVPQSYVSSPTQAKSDINAVFGKVFKREGSDKEIQAVTKILNDAQKKNPSKYVNGVTYGGLDKEQFLTDLITSGKYEANPKLYPGVLGNLAKEAATVKEKSVLAKETAIDAAEQQVQSYARANGIVLSPSDAAMYATRINNGESIDSIASVFRKIASVSQPKSIADLLNAGTDLATIYQPYKSAMASVLELNPNDIQLTDPALTKAISGDKAMTSYEFQRELRKDPRWQYTNNAREDVSNSVTKVLQDFGFVG